MIRAADPLWYLSFAGETGWLGGALVHGQDVVAAAREAHRLGINPGGEVLGVAVPSDAEVPADFIGRRLDLEDVSALDVFGGGSGEVARGSAADLAAQAREL